MARQLENVLIGTSLTEASDAVVRAGADLARWVGAKVHLVHGYSVPMTYGGAPYVPEMPLEGVFEAERMALLRKMDNQIDRLLGNREVVAGVHLEMGPAHRLLVEMAEMVKADLIVVGATETPGLSRIFGSTADRVVRKAACPVLVVRDEMALPPQRVLLPVDLSHLSAEAFEAGMGLLARIAGPERYPETEALFVLDPTAKTYGATDAQVEGLADLELRRFITAHAAEPAWKVETRVETGFPSEEILGRIEEWKPDLVVLGTHGRSGFERFMLGSIATAVMRNGETSVLVIPPKAMRGEAVVEEKKEEGVLVI